MARKNYSEEFRRQAVDLYETTPGATMRQIGAELGISRHTLADWVRQHGTGRTTPAAADVPAPRSEETDAEKIARLEAEVTRLRVEKKTVETEREILQKAAKYFAGETNW